MKKLDPTMAQQVAQAISVFQEQRTGHPPKAVTVVLSDDTLVVTLHEALSPAEKAVARTPEGTAQVQEFHRQLFKSSVDLLREEIKRITGVAVGEAAAEVETTTGAFVRIVFSVCPRSVSIDGAGGGVSDAERAPAARRGAARARRRSPRSPRGPHRWRSPGRCSAARGSRPQPKGTASDRSVRAVVGRTFRLWSNRTRQGSASMRRVGSAVPVDGPRRILDGR